MDDTSGQQMIDEFISKLPSDKDEYVIPGVSGPVDLSIIEAQGRAPTIIRFQHGEITHLFNLPQSVRALYIDQNNFSELPQDGMRELKILSCNNNHISRFDAGNFSNLEELYLNKNDIGQLTELPPTLKVLEINNNNDLRILDLRSAPDLKTVSCTNCSNLQQITGVCQADSAGFKLNYDRDNGVHVEYIDAGATSSKSKSGKSVIENTITVDEYYQLKRKYQMMRKRNIDDIVKMPISLKKKKKMVRAIPNKCVECGGKGGTHFWRENDVLRAVCDATPKCDLNLRVNAGFYANINYLMDVTQDDMQEKRANIIRLKMDTLFNYMTESESAKRFKQDLETYQSDDAMFNTYKDYAENMVNDPIKARLVKKKTQEIYRVLHEVRQMLEEYNKTGDKMVLSDAVEKQVKELHTEIDALRNLKYPVMEMVDDPDMSGVKCLRQTHYNPDLLDYPLHNI
jgi:hypothetical protein